MDNRQPSPKEIFFKAIQLDSPENLRDYLDSACGVDWELRKRVEELIGAHQNAGKFLGEFTKSVETTGQPNLKSYTGKQIGPYKLLEVIGEGGMGTVFMAQQNEPVRRRVALKLVRSGMDTKEVAARFEVERRALALMDHPNIAKVLDAGTTGDGSPYFVMELVHGIPLTEFCDGSRLNPRERLELFVGVCNAVQHAHQKGIIHRDIKPLNVLVSMIDGKPVPKVIDFGLAKAIQCNLTPETMFTNFGQVLGTFQYMSPEQTEMNALDVDTRTDVYSLGVMLYELLTGSTPLDQSRIRKQALDRILQMIRETDPPRPSRRLSDSGEAAKTICARRQIEPNRLGQLLRGDLDWIVMKALEKELNRRYDSASSLSADIQRYLADQPVEARPPSAGYRFTKYFRRHRVSVLASAAVFLALLVGFSTAIWQSIRASDAETKALIALENAQVAKRSAQELAQSESAARKRSQQLAESEALARKQSEENYQRALTAVDRYLTRVADDARLKQGFAPLRKQLLEDARQYYQQFLGERKDDKQLSADILHASFQNARLASLIGSKREAIGIYQELVETIEKELKARTNDTSLRSALATCHLNLGETHLELDEYEPAATHMERALQLKLELSQENPSDVDTMQELAECQDSLSTLMCKMYQQSKALEYLQPAIAFNRRQCEQSPENPDFQSELGARLNQLANIHMMSENEEQAISALREACLHQQRAVDMEPQNVRYTEYLANHLFNLGIMQAHSSDKQAAIESLTNARKTYQRLVQSDPSVFDWQLRLARSLIELSDLFDKPALSAEKSRSLQQATAILENQLAINPQWNNGMALLAQTWNSLALLHYQANEYDQALDEWKRAKTNLLQLVERDPINERTHSANLARNLCQIGRALADLQRHEESVQAFSESEARFQRLITARRETEDLKSELAECYNGHALSLLKLNQFDEAFRNFGRCDQLLNELIATEPDNENYVVLRGGVYCNCGNTALAQGDVDQALNWYDQAITALNSALTRHPASSVGSTYLFNSHRCRCSALMDAGRYSAAIDACSEAMSQTNPRIALSFQMQRAYCYAKTGDTVSAVKDIDQLTDRVNFDARALLNAAEVFSLCAERLENENVELSKKYVARSLEWLQKALLTGEINAFQVKENADLKFLWNDPEFNNLIEQ